MKLSLAPLLILLFIGIKSISQETKKVVKRPEDKTRNLVIKYYVLKSNHDIKHGPYTYYSNGKLFISGFYKNGKKDSVWHRYNTEGEILAKKEYTDGKRTGTWEFYDKTGAVEWLHDFSTDSSLNVPSALLPNYVYLASDGQWVKGRANRVPVKLFATWDWQYFLSRNLRYPAEAIDKGQQGKGVVEVTVDENGEAIDYSISPESSYSLLGEEAMRIVKLFDPEFLPAEKDGKKVKVKVPFTVQFRLGNQ
jgi:TonB family protein